VKQTKAAKPVSILALVCVLMLVMSACSGKGSSPSGGESSPSAVESSAAPSTEAAATQVASPAEEKSDLGGREIVISAWWDGTPKADTPEGEAALNRQKEVEKKYNVKIKYIGQDYGKTAEKLSSTVMAGAPYADIVLVPDDQIMGLMSGGYFTALDDFMNVKDESKLPDTVIKAGSDSQGKAYGFVTNFPLFDNGGLFFNKRIFKEANLTSPSDLQAQGNWNWDTFLEAAQKLTVDKNGDGKIDQWGISSDNSQLSMNLIYSNNAAIYDSDTQKFGLDSPNALEGLEMFNKLINEYKVVRPKVEGESWEAYGVTFIEGNAAMYTAGLWEAGDRMHGKMKDEFGYVHFPKGPKAENYVVGIGQLHMNFIPKGVKEPRAVYKIWQELQDWDLETSNRAWAEARLYDEASVQSALETSSMVKFARFNALGIPPVYGPLMDDIAKGGVTPATAVAQVLPALQANADKLAKGQK
jgi:multiple sugar transport system substrate-binding protein